MKVENELPWVSVVVAARNSRPFRVTSLNVKDYPHCVWIYYISGPQVCISSPDLICEL